MPLTAIIVSRDRPAQLDLLLRSVTCNADDLFDSIYVLWTSSSGEYAAAYGICDADHPSVDFYSEGHFHGNVRQLLGESDDYVTFLTDDSYFYRELPDIDPCAVLRGEPNALCFSLRLGRNTTYCYPLKGRDQRSPDFQNGGGYLVWEWGGADADFGYPGSLDGHIFRKADFMSLIEGSDNWWNPNTLEDTLCRNVYRMSGNLMASFEKSVLVGIPANRTSISHPGNRFGEKHLSDPYVLNKEYLEEKRILFPNVHPDTIMAAHQELPLETL